MRSTGKGTSVPNHILNFFKNHNVCMTKGYSKVLKNGTKHIKVSICYCVRGDEMTQMMQNERISALFGSSEVSDNISHRLSGVALFTTRYFRQALV